MSDKANPHHQLQPQCNERKQEFVIFESEKAEALPIAPFCRRALGGIEPCGFCDQANIRDVG
jgi:hypothetical protein